MVELTYTARHSGRPNAIARVNPFTSAANRLILRRLLVDPFFTNTRGIRDLQKSLCLLRLMRVALFLYKLACI